MTKILKHLGLKRQAEVRVPLDLAQVRKSLSSALAEDIILSGTWQLTRRYWGHLSHDHLTLHGPRANRQFCFLTRGNLRPGDTPEQTRIDLEITLGQGSEMQLLGAIAVVSVMFPIILRWFGVFLLPLVLAFLYGMTQWHFAHYTAEIRKLVRDLALGKTNQEADEPQSDSLDF